MIDGMYTLTMLPVELLYEIQLFATSHTLPQTCNTLHRIFASTPPSYRAQYLIACTDSSRIPKDVVLTKMLRYPICTQDVLDAYFRRRDPCTEPRSAPELPRRLFRALAAPQLTSESELIGAWSDRDPPLPLLRYLYACPHMCPPNVNSHDGYALTKAVQVRFIPLVRFLLDHGATPTCKSNLPIIIAIHRKDLGLVRMLVERMDTGTSKGKGDRKRRKLEDRVVVTPQMLKAAVKCRAQDIVEYLTREKGCIPDMQTLLLMR
ncbi:hypothetical protein JVT61DRAFT_4337 [Boletus reticuloceps]|uniref:Ankyrin repeat domain-containing protein n=1 Tax=Boletus reticuloceps TaxID=495285 RepID=A0A8I2YKX3_9AGAM|nr:hypothetical protein JVT61DRAFT_4337 [Boletus reticuloceps]